MLKLGQIQTLEVVKTTDFGVYLSDPESTNQEKVLLPKNQVPSGLKINNEIEVFLYKDSEDRLIATTTIPPLTLGNVALLKVKEVSSIGAFLDWGLAKDLLLPFKEQTMRVKTNDLIVVALYIDKSSRLCATMKVYDYLRTDSPYQKDDRILGTVYEVSDEFGAFVAVDNLYSGLIPKKELYRILKPGDSVEARVTSVKPDGKLDLSIREKAFVQLEEDASFIFEKLKEEGGSLPFHDKTDASIIKNEFNLSKNAFKRAIGHLMKENKITITSSGIFMTGKKDT